MHPEPEEGRSRAAVLGSPIGHSKSPLLHRAAYRSLGVDCEYSAVEVDERGIEDFLGTVRTGRGWRGLSVTMPLKAAVARLVDTTTEPATALGVVNTVVVDPTGTHLTGHNTDVVGIAHALAAGGAGRPSHGVILGGGGTAAAAVAGLARLGASSAAVLVRRPEAATDLLRIGGAVGIEVRLLPWGSARQHLRAADVVISTLPPRAADALAAELAADPTYSTPATLLDVAYDPWPSALATAWQQAGGTIVPGLDMLLHQAVEQVRLFFPDRVEDPAAVLAVMCDAVGAPRR
ncbi:shikimate dehydrogenase [Arthrobacter agilis]|uniref:shikimate dehydrogenase n=1 Tax=Arthrobacter agilis TaxID=37921 RepID=UPI000B35ED77|nr:shikimate dehydrogenase [Arthrobacter agilis]OUM45250.1 shikimate dehydrogenase [Arthrobacter agilis]PPB47486.1 shikimate dehydrogenase [Arthrobacter agilis]TPV21736.1 shikimate dehydrogenase [Arthrobacter agilis]VDR32185.1 Shikimate dehydrogenase [Arthrobacter agilis]